MTAAHSFNRRHERGDALIEALIGVLLMSVIALGLSYATSRSMIGLRNVNTHNIVVSAVRDALSQSASLQTYCASGNGPTVQISDARLTLGVRCSQNTATDVSVAVVMADGEGATSEHSHSKTSTLSYNLPANKVVTSMSLTLPANESSAAMLGGDGSMQVAF